MNISDFSESTVTGRKALKGKYSVDFLDWTPLPGGSITGTMATVCGLVADTVYEFQIVAKLGERISAAVATYAKMKKV